MLQSIQSLALEHRIDGMFAPYTRPGSPGAVVAVMRGSHIEVCKGYGLASIEFGVSIGPRTRFREWPKAGRASFRPTSTGTVT